MSTPAESLIDMDDEDRRLPGDVRNFREAIMDGGPFELTLRNPATGASYQLGSIVLTNMGVEYKQQGGYQAPEISLTLVPTNLDGGIDGL